MYRVRPDFLKVLGVDDRIMSLLQITSYFKAYVENQKLCDAAHPNRLMRVKDDPLGKVFGVEEFFLKDAVGLLGKQIQRVQCNITDLGTTGASGSSIVGVEGSSPNPSSGCSGPSKPNGEVVVGAVMKEDHAAQEDNAAQSIQQLPQSTQQLTRLPPTTSDIFFPANILGNSEFDMTTAGCSKEKDEKRKHSDDSEESDIGSKKVKSSQELECVDGGESEFYWSDDYISPAPSNDSPVLSYVNRPLPVYHLEDHFDVEFDVVSLKSDNNGSCTDTDSEIEEVLAAVLITAGDSDCEFWADDSDDDESGTDPELSKDKWSCRKCDLLNNPQCGKCLRCGKQRNHWLPDVSGRRHPAKKRKRRERDRAATNRNLPSWIPSISDQGLTQLPVTLTSSQDLPSTSNEQTESQETLASSVGDAPPFEERVAVRRGVNVGVVNPSASPSDDLCPLCLVNKKTAVIGHGKSSHQYCCYKCAKNIQKKDNRCPVCRLKIQSVLRNFYIA